MPPNSQIKMDKYKQQGGGEGLSTYPAGHQQHKVTTHLVYHNRGCFDILQGRQGGAQQDQQIKVKLQAAIHITNSLGRNRQK